MNAKKCDRCGKFYDVYGESNDKGNPNSILFASVDTQGRYFSYNYIEFCPECINKIKEFVNNKTEENQ